MLSLIQELADMTRLTKEGVERVFNVNLVLNPEDTNDSVIFYEAEAQVGAIDGRFRKDGSGGFVVINVIDNQALPNLTNCALSPSHYPHSTKLPDWHCSIPRQNGGRLTYVFSDKAATDLKTVVIDDFQ